MSAKFRIRVKTVECVLIEPGVTIVAVNPDTMETTVNTVFYKCYCTQFSIFILDPNEGFLNYVIDHHVHLQCAA